MEFLSEPQKQVYEKIRPWMQEIFGAFVKMRDDAPGFHVVVGSAYASVYVLPWKDDDATVMARSYVVTNIELTPDLLHYLLRENEQLRFGAFGVDSDNDICYSHTVVGSTIDKEELQACVLAVVAMADKYDDEIVGRWGGQRAIDRAI